MKHLKILSIALLALVILSSCATGDAEPTGSVAPANAAAQVTPSPTISPTKQAISEISDGLVEDFEADRFNVKYVGKTVTVTATQSGLSAQVLASKDAGTLPENWNDTISSFETVAAKVSDLAAQTSLGAVDTVLYVYSDDGTDEIYLTIANGKTIYSVFDEPIGSTPSGKMTKAVFDSISIGMTYQEVVNLVGSMGEVMSDIDMGLGSEYRTTMYQWDCEGSLGANAHITIQDGKVVLKAQYGLE